MSNHNHNWQVKYVATLPNGTTLPGVAWGRTRADARRKATSQHVDAPHGVRVKTQTPVKFEII